MLTVVYGMLFAFDVSLKQLVHLNYVQPMPSPNIPTNIYLFNIKERMQ